MEFLRLGELRHGSGVLLSSGIVQGALHVVGREEYVLHDGVVLEVRAGFVGLSLLPFVVFLILLVQ